MYIYIVIGDALSRAALPRRGLHVREHLRHPDPAGQVAGGGVGEALRDELLGRPTRDELYKNRSSRKTDSQRLFSRE